MNISKMNEMTREEKVDFFCRCQKLLIEYHPSSVYLITKENWKEKAEFAHDFINKYKGFCYATETICILFNKVRVDDPNDPVGVVKRHLFQEPRLLDFNALIIDFVVFRQLSDCQEFARRYYSPQIQWVLFARHGDIKIYPTAKLMSGVI